MARADRWSSSDCPTILIPWTRPFQIDPLKPFGPTKSNAFLIGLDAKSLNVLTPTSSSLSPTSPCCLDVSLHSPLNIRRIAKVSESRVVVSLGGYPSPIWVVDLCSGNALLRINTAKPRVHPQGTIWAFEPIPSDFFGGQVKMLTGDNSSGHASAVVWDTETGRIASRLPTPPDVYCIQYVHEWDRRAFVGGYSLRPVRPPEARPHLKVYDVPTNRYVDHLPGHTKCVRGLSVDTQMTSVVSFCYDKQIRFFDPRTMRITSKCETSSELVSGTCAPDIHLAIAGLNDGAVELWDNRKLESRVKKIHCAGGTRTNVQWIARLQRNTIACTLSRMTCKVSLESGKTERLLDSCGSSCCTIGMPYDSPSCSPPEDPDMIERLSFLGELLPTSSSRFLCRVLRASSTPLFMMRLPSLL